MATLQGEMKFTPCVKHLQAIALWYNTCLASAICTKEKSCHCVFLNAQNEYALHTYESDLVFRGKIIWLL
jgi:hypothetical protein